MKQIEIKWTGECRKCGAALPVGVLAMYEKSMGVFCLGHEPTDPEEIRQYRLAKAEARAERLEGWAAKREEKAEAQLNSYPSIRHDWAFITQPGHIPLRARMNKTDHRAMESLQVANAMRQKAENIRQVRVAGDAERKRQEAREEMDQKVKKGSRVFDVIAGEGTVVGVYKKSYRIAFDRGFTWARDKSYVRSL